MRLDLAQVLDHGVGAGGDDPQPVAPGREEQVAAGLAELEAADDRDPAAEQLGLDVDGRGVGAGVGDPQAGQVARDGVAVAQHLELERAAVAGQRADGGDGDRAAAEAHVGLEGGRVARGGRGHLDLHVVGPPGHLEVVAEGPVGHVRQGLGAVDVDVDRRGVRAVVERADLGGPAVRRGRGREGQDQSGGQDRADQGAESCQDDLLQCGAGLDPYFGPARRPVAGNRRGSAVNRVAGAFLLRDVGLEDA